MEIRETVWWKRGIVFVANLTLEFFTTFAPPYGFLRAGHEIGKGKPIEVFVWLVFGGITLWLFYKKRTHMPGHEPNKKGGRKK